MACYSLLLGLSLSVSPSFIVVECVCILVLVNFTFYLLDQLPFINRVRRRPRGNYSNWIKLCIALKRINNLKVFNNFFLKSGHHFHLKHKQVVFHFLSHRLHIVHLSLCCSYFAIRWVLYCIWSQHCIHFPIPPSWIIQENIAYFFSSLSSN